MMTIRAVLLGAAAVILTTSPACSEDGGPNDAQIAHIAHKAGEIDVAAGRQALARAQDPAVRAFAETMVRDHVAVNEQALALVKKLGVTPEANPVSEGLAKEAAAQATRLAALKGAAYDRAYVANEVAFHRTVNEALRTTLIPSADNAELKALLETGLTLFQAHQAHAEQLAARVDK